MRRHLTEDPVTLAAPFARNVAIFAVVVSAVALWLVRRQTDEAGPALVVLASGLALAIGAILLAGLAFIRVWREGARGIGAALMAVLVAFGLLAYPAYAGLRGLRLPPISDVTTDTEQPPAFSRSQVAFAARDGRYPPDPGQASRDAQKGSYALIAPLTLDIEPENAFELVRKAAINRKWQIVEALRPGGRTGNGRLDAIAHSRILNLPADITVRIRPRADGARIDVRSATRFGSRDFGTNADHIRGFLDEVANLAIATK